MIVVDNYIEDKRLLTRVNNDPFFNKSEPYWWGEWWVQPFTSLRQEVITHLFAQSKRFVNTDVSGFKHWVDECKEDYSPEPTFDKDEECFKETGEYSYPKIGAIYFHEPKTDEVEGGWLQIWDDQTTSSPYELVRPKYNRLVIFDMSKFYTIQTPTKGSYNYLNVSFWDNPIWRFETFLK